MELMSEATWASPRRGRSAGLRFAGEEGLARRAKAGDTAAFAEIFRRYNRDLGRYCQAILGSREQAEDALQNTLVAAMKALPGETREIALKPWLYRVAYNESISLLRQRRPVAELDPELAEPASDPRVTSERREGLRALLADLEQLPERQRGALVMRELADLSFAEIAATYDFSEGAARQAIYEARGALLEMAEGRDMHCAEVRSQISEDDKRILRGRRLRSHLRECDGCREFEAAIDDRRAQFAQIAPLAPAAAAGILQSVLGTSAAGGGGGGLAVLGGAAGGGAALKSAAAVVAVVAAGVGTADVTGVIDLNGSGKGSSAEVAEPAGAAAGGSAAHGRDGERGTAAAQGGHGGAAGNDEAAGNGEGSGSAAAKPGTVRARDRPTARATATPPGRATGPTGTATPSGSATATAWVRPEPRRVSPEPRRVSPSRRRASR